MGQPINIFNLAKKLAKIKLNYNPNYNFKYEVTGLKPGEKLRETLKGKKEVLKKLNNEIFEVTQNYQTKGLFNLYYKNLLIKVNRIISYYKLRLARLPGSNYAISSGFACGAMVSFTPLLGFHFIFFTLMVIQ